jgi:hypothetical protein
LGDKEVIICFLPVPDLLPGRKSLLGCLLEAWFCVHLKKLALQSLFSRNLAGEIGNEFQQRQVFITVRLGILLTFFLWECTANFAATRLCIPHSALS